MLLMVETSEPTTAKRIKKTLIITIIGVMLVIFLPITLSTLYFVFRAPADVQSGMEKYLEDRYGEQFIVEKPVVVDSGLGVSGMWRATAHPEKDKTLDIEVRRPEKAGPESTRDQYDKALWSRDEYEPVKTFLSSIYPSTPDFSVNANFNGAITNPIRGTMPHFNEAVKLYRKDIVYGITVRVTDDVNKKTLAYHSKQATKIVDYTKRKGIGIPSLRYVINLKDKDARYVCSLFREKVVSPIDMASCSREYSGKE